MFAETFGLCLHRVDVAGYDAQQVSFVLHQ